MSIKQINAAYMNTEDRILFRFNTQDQSEYRLWLTRRVCLFLLAAITHLQAKKLESEHSSDTAKAIQEFKKEALIEALKTANAGEQTYESGVQFPLGFDPLLVMDVTCALTKNEADVAGNQASISGEFSDSMSINFLLPGGANLSLQLEGNMLRAMCLLLDQLRNQAGWGEAILTVKNEDQPGSLNDENSSQKVSLH